MSTNLTTEQAIAMIMHQVTSISKRHLDTVPSHTERVMFTDMLANELATHADKLSVAVMSEYSEAIDTIANAFEDMR
jgi:hypothetical protein